MSPLKRFQQILILSVIFLLPFYFIKFKYGWISFNIVELLILALLAMWFFNKEKKYFIQNTKYFLPTSLIFSGLLLSIIVNKNHYVGLGVLKGWFILPIIFAIILFDYLKRDEKLVDKVWSTLFASGALVSVEGVYYWLSGLLTFDGRLKIFFDSPNQLAMFLAPVFLIGWIKYGFEEPLPSRREGGKGRTLENNWKLWLAVVGIFLIAFNLYLTKSYGAWLAIAMALGVIFWLKYGKKTHKKYLAVCAIIFVVLIGWASFNKFKNIQSLGDRSSLASRVMIWKSAGLMIEKNPVLGIGPGHFQNTYLEYQKYFPPYLEWAVPQPHNLFLAFWLETGLLGLIGFIWLIVVFFKDNKKARESEFQAAWLCLAIILYFLLHGLIDTTYWRNDMAILFWIVLAVNLFLVSEKFERLDKGK